MSNYTTGELAKLCDVTVRTVQFYDRKHILNPSELSEGGRRVYYESDLEKLRLICLLKSLGLSLNSIKEILQSENQNIITNTLLDERAKQLNDEIYETQKQLGAIDIIKKNLNSKTPIALNLISDINAMIRGKRILTKTYLTMIVSGIIIDTILLGTLVLGFMRGTWLPFAICIPFTVAWCYLLVKMYYKNTAYICPNCSKKFKPILKEFFFAKHTLKTRKLTCVKCKAKDWCIETYPDIKDSFDIS